MELNFMLRFSSILSTLLFMSCINLPDGIIQNKKWRMVKQVVVTEDKTGIRTEERTKDFIMDKMNFETENKLIIESYGSSDSYLYSTADSILTFSPESDKKITWEYRIITSTKDSLVLKRREIYGSDSALKITATLHLASIPAK